MTRPDSCANHTAPELENAALRMSRKEDGIALRCGAPAGPFSRTIYRVPHPAKAIIISCIPKKRDSSSDASRLGPDPNYYSIRCHERCTISSRKKIAITPVAGVFNSYDKCLTHV